MHLDKQFFMPAEWHPHQRCWMGFPCRPNSWPFELSRAQASYVAVAHAIAQFEPVTMVVHPDYVDEAKRLCHQSIEIIELPMNDAWLRDTGPTFLIDNQSHSAGINWQFNGWGGSHADFQLDNELAKNILSIIQLPCYDAPLTLEGGAIHVDGEGTLLTTEQCLFSRNPHLTPLEIETYLRQYLGITHIIWLTEGLQQDETAGHIDNLACFVKPGVVVALSSNDPQDNQYAILQDNLRRLRTAKDAKGRTLEVIEIEQPNRRDHPNLGRLTLSYINFYMANGGIVMPIFNDPADHAAQETIQKLFPQRRVIALNTLDLIHGGGNIHCITQQQPNLF